MFPSVECDFSVAVADIQRLGITSTLRAKRLLGALRDRANAPRRQLETADRKIARRINENTIRSR